jgi:hypothetical protein
LARARVNADDDLLRLHLPFRPPFIVAHPPFFADLPIAYLPAAYLPTCLPFCGKVSASEIRLSQRSESAWTDWHGLRRHQKANG